MNNVIDYLKEVLKATGKGLKGYLKAECKLSVLTFVVLCSSFFLIGIEHWGIKAFGIAIVDIIPVLGSGMIMVPWAVIRFIMGDTTIAWQLGLVYIVASIIRQIAEPFVTGKEIGVRPLYTLISTVICVLLFGPLGALAGALVAVIIKAIFEVKFIRRL